jgi:Tol biopolymer transport system component
MLGKQGAYDTDPRYSPDGKTILFSSVSDGKQADICLMKSDGFDKVCLTAGPDHDFNPIFSPDGARIYFVRAKFFGNYSPIARPSWHKNDVYSINVDGTGLTQVTHKGFYRLVNLSIHPDGKKLLARVTAEDKAHSMWIISLEDTNKLEPLEPVLDEYRTTGFFLKMTSIQYDHLFNPMFSPDGKSLLFTWHYPSTPYSQIFIMDLETRKAKRITSLEKLMIWGDPSFSHDGKLVVFSTLKSDALLRYIPALWIVNKDGSGLRMVTFVKTQ